MNEAKESSLSRWCLISVKTIIASQGDFYFPPVTVQTSQVILFDTSYPSSVSELQMES
jgi:hypothetical protein